MENNWNLIGTSKRDLESLWIRETEGSSTIMLLPQVCLAVAVVSE